MMNQYTKQHGFGMIEILISMLIFMIGIVGVSSMQGQAIQATNDSQQRSQAVWMSHELAERIKVNPEGLESSRYQSISTSASGNITTYCAGPLPADCDNNACNANEMADYDVYTLICNNKHLNIKTLSITCTGVANCGFGADITINIRWESLGARERFSGGNPEQTLSLTLKRW